MSLSPHNLGWLKRSPNRLYYIFAGLWYHRGNSCWPRSRAQIANFSKNSKLSIFGTLLRRVLENASFWYGWAKMYATFVLVNGSSRYEKTVIGAEYEPRTIYSTIAHFCRTIHFWVLWCHLVSDHNTNGIIKRPSAVYVILKVMTLGLEVKGHWVFRITFKFVSKK